MKIYEFLRERLTEGGSFASITAVLVYFGIKPETSDILLDLAVAIIGFIGLLLPEGKTTE